jgi:hypothetical protein
LPVARSNSGARSSSEVFIAVVASTLISFGTADPRGGGHGDGQTEASRSSLRCPPRQSIAWIRAGPDPVNPNVTKHLRHESCGAIKLPPLAVGAGCVGFPTVGTIHSIALYELANFAMNFHRRGVE